MQVNALHSPLVLSRESNISPILQIHVLQTDDIMQGVQMMEELMVTYWDAEVRFFD